MAPDYVPDSSICTKCTRYLRDTCIEKCQPEGKLRYFQARSLNGEPIPPFPKRLFDSEVKFHERMRTVSTWLAWTVERLNELQKEKESGY